METLEDLVNAAEAYLAACEEECVPGNLLPLWYALSAATADAREVVNGKA